MAAPKGNNYWQFRNKHGRDHKYDSVSLWEEFVKYAKWMEANPLKEQRVFHSSGEITKTDITKMRAMTEISFCLFADMSHDTFLKYKTEQDFIVVTRAICDAIYSQKFEGASADMLNSNIIARDLGLKEKSEVGHTLLKPPAEIKFTINEGVKNASD